MAEYGKLIKITFDQNLRYLSVENCLAGMDIYATEKVYVPDGDDIVVHYDEADVEIDGVVVAKRDFAGGNKTDTGSAQEDSLLTLDPIEGTPQVIGQTSYYGQTALNTWSNFRGHVFEITSPQIFKTCQWYAYYGTTETFTFKIMKIAAGSYMGSAGEEVESKTEAFDSSGYKTITWNTYLDVGRYWIGIAAVSDPTLRHYYDRYGFTFPFTGVGMTCPADGYWDTSAGDVTLTWAGLYSCTFTPATFPTSGTWTFPIDIDTITDLGVSRIKWVEDLPTGCSAIVYTAVNADDETEPTVWEEQIYNGYDAASLTQGYDYTGKFLWIKIELSTTDTSKTPTISEPLFKIIEYTDQKSLVIEIGDGQGINKATGDVTIDYTKSTGGLSSDAAGHPKVEDFSETFTPTGLAPIDNPANIEAIELSLTPIVVTRTYITLEEAFSNPVLEIALGLVVTRTHIDDLDP